MKLTLKILCIVGLCQAGPVHAATMPPALADLAARLLPSVVSVASTDPVTDNSNANDNGDNDDGDGGDDGSVFKKTADTSGSVLPPPKAEEALGSGFVFDPAGYILTNNHVIDGATSVTVTFQDGTILPATVVGRDKDGDLAVLKVNAGHNLPAVTFGDSSKLRVGDWVLAIGNPFGLPGSTSAGIVSALDRNISENKFDDFIQTDATINRGNSGGPLFDMDGHVIGVNSAIYSPSGGSVGIGFAIPSAMAAPVAESLKTTGSIQRGWLGLAAQDVTPDIAKIFGLPDTTGALVGGVSPNSPAANVLQPGDVLVALAGVAIPNPRALLIRTAEIPSGQSAIAKYWRNGSLTQSTLVITAPPPAISETVPKPAAAPTANTTIASIGLSFAGAGVPGANGGVAVLAVTAGGPSAKAGVVADNTIEAIGDTPVTSATDLQSDVKNLIAAKQPLAILLVSGDMADGSNPGPRWVSVSFKK